MGELHDFAERGDLDGVRRLLDSGVPVDALDERDETALHGAAAFGHTEVLRVLLERGAAVDQTDGDQFRTALMAAAGAEVLRRSRGTPRARRRLQCRRRL